MKIIILVEDNLCRYTILTNTLICYSNTKIE